MCCVLGGRTALTCACAPDILCREARKIPGPGSYKTKAGHKRRFTSFSTAAPETGIDKMARLSGQVPGPGAYGEGTYSNKLPTHVPTTKIDVTKPPSDLDHHLRQVAKMPGPGQYGAPGQQSRTAKGAKFSRSFVGSDTDMRVRDAALKPGPGEYSVPGVPDIKTLPHTHKDWKAYVSYFPQMRYREN